MDKVMNRIVVIVVYFTLGIFCACNKPESKKECLYEGFVIEKQESDGRISSKTVVKTTNAMTTNQDDCLAHCGQSQGSACSPQFSKKHIEAICTWNRSSLNFTFNAEPCP